MRASGQESSGAKVLPNGENGCGHANQGTHNQNLSSGRK